MIRISNTITKNIIEYCFSILAFFLKQAFHLGRIQLANATLVKHEFFAKLPRGYAKVGHSAVCPSK